MNLSVFICVIQIRIIASCCPLNINLALHKSIDEQSSIDFSLSVLSSSAASLQIALMSVVTRRFTSRNTMKIEIIFSKIFELSVGQSKILLLKNSICFVNHQRRSTLNNTVTKPSSYPLSLCNASCDLLSHGAKG